MQVHLIKRASIEQFCIQNAQSRISFEAWLTKLKFANWQLPIHMQMTFPKTDLLGNGSNRAVFDIGGNKYRMIVQYVFGTKQVHLFICWIGTHAAYDKLCKLGEQYSVNIY